MGTAVATTTKNAVAVKYDPKAFDFGRMERAAKAASVAMDGKELAERKQGVSFPGMKYQFNGKTGIWNIYDPATKKTEPMEDDMAKVAVNYQQAVIAWRTFVEYKKDGKDKKRPDYQHVVAMHDAESLPKREELGQTDEEEWDVGADGSPMDPWRCVILVPVRCEGSEEINHIEFGSASANRTWFYFYSRLAAEAMLHMGEMPVVKIGTKDVEFEIDVKDKKTGEVILDKKTGKPKRAKVVNTRPNFDITGWTDMLECDYPKAAEGAEQIEPPSDDVGEVETRARTQKEEPAKPAHTKGGKRKVKAADDEDSI